MALFGFHRLIAPTANPEGRTVNRRNAVGHKAVALGHDIEPPRRLDKQCLLIEVRILNSCA